MVLRGQGVLSITISGTGNLHKYKAIEHVGSSWMPCPYSSSTNPDRVRALLGLATYDSLPTRVDHVDGDVAYYMRPSRRGRWGYECSFSNCPYYLDNGRRYFYA